MTALHVRLLGVLSNDSDLAKRWENLVQSNPASGVMQSLAWAQMKRGQGLTSQHFGIFEEDELVGGAIFYTGKRLNGTGILVAPEGPVLPWSDRVRSTECMRLLADAAQSYSIEYGIMSMRIEPRLAPPLPPVFREFGRAPADLVPKETLYLNLGGTEEEILAQMKPKGRYNIKQASKHGVVVSEHRSADYVAEFYQCIQQASARDGFALESRTFFEQAAQVMCPTNNATFLIAKHEDDLLGAMLLITYAFVKAAKEIDHRRESLPV